MKKLRINRSAVVAALASGLLLWHGYGLAATMSPERAVREFGPAAEKGDDEASFRIGQAFMDAKRLDEAEPWLKRAAEHNYVAAQMALAQIYFEKGKKPDDKIAAGWVLRAASAGNADAQYAMALLYQNGRGVPQDDVQAVSWLEKAAAGRKPEAKFLLGVAYYQGVGVTQDFGKAAAIFHELAEKGDPGAQHNLGVMYKFGQGVKQNNAEAVAWLSLSVQSYPPGSARDAILKDMTELRAKLSKQDAKRAEKLYNDHLSGLVKAGLASVAVSPPQPPDQTQGGKLPAPPSSREAGLSGSLQTGIRWQTDANGAASSYLNNPAPPASALPIRDWNYFALGKISWIADVARGVVDNIQTDITLYKTFQHDTDVIDLSYGELSVGPNISLTDDRRNVIRPYATANFVETDNKIFETAEGGGVSYKHVFSKETVFIASLEETWESYRKLDTAPQNDDLSGNETEVSGRLFHGITPWLIGNISLTWHRDDTRRDRYSYDGVVAGNGYVVKLPPLIESAEDPATLYGNVSYQHRNYDAPNPAISPTIARSDNEWQFMLTGNVPIAKRWSISPTIQRTLRKSSLPDYEYQNTLASIAVVYRF
ncbi:MAG TPA: surface lipoprotein assembly modifier [Patescibacteria group bacterium]|nr:surface lipoprotein assembly modifier [Patescibacteria group bacterium]